MNEIKKEIVTSFSQIIYNLVKTFERILNEIESDSIKFTSYSIKMRKIEKVSRLEKDSVLSLLTLQSHEAIKIAKTIFNANYNLSHSTIW